jgi:sugar/nucleoside kinase (ribokinase family)
LHVTSPEYSHESVNHVSGVVRAIGGKGWITASTIAWLGSSPTLFALVGEDSRIAPTLSTSVRSELQQCLDHDHEIWTVLGGERHRVMYSWFGKASPYRLDAALARLDNVHIQSAVVYIAAEHPAVVATALARARRERRTLVVNLSGALVKLILPDDASLFTELARSADVLLLNEFESELALRLLGIRSWSELTDSAVREIIVTNGSKGGRYAMRPFRDWAHYDAVPARHMASEIGAGDTFNGAFLVARYVRGETVGDACDFAAGIATACVESPRPSLLGEMA